MTPAGIAEVLREAADLLTDISDLSKDCTTAMMEAAGRYAHKLRTLAEQLETMEPAAWQCRFSREPYQYCGSVSSGKHEPQGHHVPFDGWPTCPGEWVPLYQFPDEKGDRKDGDET